MKKTISILAFLLLATLSSGIFAAVPDNPPYPFDRSIYQQIDKFVKQLIITTENAPKNEDERKAKERLHAELEKLSSVDKGNSAKLISHTLIYLALMKGRNKEIEKKVWIAPMIIKFHLPDYSSQTLLSENVPYLEVSNPKFKEVFYDLLDNLLYRRSAGNYNLFRRYLARQYLGKNESWHPAKGFVEYLFRRHVNKAGEMFDKVYFKTSKERKEFRDYRKTISDISDPDKRVYGGYPPAFPASRDQSQWVKDEKVILALEKLSKSTNWWRRYYIVELLKRFPEYRIPEVVARLSKDSHPLIQGELGFLIVK